MGEKHRRKAEADESGVTEHSVVRILSRIPINERSTQVPKRLYATDAARGEPTGKPDASKKVSTATKAASKSTKQSYDKRSPPTTRKRKAPKVN